jgi:hypothetical protein
MLKKILFALLFFVMPSALWAADAQVPATGQTTCNDAAGATIVCAGTGQDGELLMGAAWPDPRFTDNSDGTVTDNLTGLMWMKEANCIGDVHGIFDNDVTSGDGRVYWQRGLDFVKELNATTYDCNATTVYTDWRLPNARELESLVDVSQVNPALSPGHPFSGVVSSNYWSSSSGEAFPDYAWYVYFGNGSVYWVDKDAFTSHVWPVRAGQ